MAHAFSMNRRADKQTALLIDAALNAAASHGPFGAAAELIGHGVAQETVTRVLGKPARRRHYFSRTKSARSKPSSDGGPACRRHNHVFAAYVNAALTILKRGAVRRAESMLAQEGVPAAVISRVLFDGGPCRRHRPRRCI
ncbi:hypothetical protein [Massilia sp. ST3]|uniref:hypothetical protein n=1 Tax=Massilia sp. ST3 TaxID=2824903 RepID=UPI001B825CE0|nr:hypothetical protein [Massilia sp. ST3]MBQ5946859.1 hypothetical protein [Massilia sp. ST3]